MKKQEIISQANQEHNPIWAVVSLLGKDGKIEKSSKIRKPAVLISETQVLVNLSDTEILIITREGNRYGAIANYQLIKYNLTNDTVEGAFK